MGGLDDILGGGDAPEPTTVPLDQGTENQIDKHYANATQSTQNIADANNEGLSGINGLIQSQTQFDQKENALGMSPGATGEAIRNKYKIQLGAEIDKMKMKNTQDAELQRANKLTQIQGVLQARQNVQNEAYKRLMAAHRNKEAARSNFISSIFGVAGMVGGAMVGGPAGAMAGGGVARAMAGGPQEMQTIGDSSDRIGRTS